MNAATAWLTTRSPSLTTTRCPCPATMLQSSKHHQEEEGEEASSTLLRSSRASLEGVSLAPTGFWVMLRVAKDGYLPWQVTDDPQDALSATSAEALTMIQLLSGVDMAGAILPPDVLAKLVLHHAEAVVKRYSTTSSS